MIDYGATRQMQIGIFWFEGGATPASLHGWLLILIVQLRSSKALAESETDLQSQLLAQSLLQLPTSLELHGTGATLCVRGSGRLRWGGVGRARGSKCEGAWPKGRAQGEGLTSAGAGATTVGQGEERQGGAGSRLG